MTNLTLDVNIIDFPSIPVAMFAAPRSRVAQLQCGEIYHVA